MRLFSRLGSFFRADAQREGRAQRGSARADGYLSDDPIAAVENDPQPAARLPAAAADVFKKRFLDSILAARDSGRAALYSADPSVQMLVIPHAKARSDREEERLSSEIDAAIQQIESATRVMSSVTWSALKDARPTFEPSYMEWAGDLSDSLDGDIGIIFFVDMDAIAHSMCQAATSLGFRTAIDADLSAVRVSDGRFEAHVGVSALLAEALWTGRGPLSVIRRRASSLPAELRSFQSLFAGLERRFTGSRCELHDGAVRVVDASEGGTVRGKIDYRHVAASAKASGVPVERWLARARLEDLLVEGGDASVLIRSRAFAKARPDALIEGGDGYVLSAVRDHDGRAVPVVRADDDPPGRFEHFRDEAARQLAFFSFVGHAFVLEQGAQRAVVLVGDKAASLSFHPALLKGALEQLLPLDDEMMVCSFSENTLCAHAPSAPPFLQAQAKERAVELEGDLVDEPSDSLDVQRTVTMPEIGLGHFELTLVQDQYFALRDASIAASMSQGIGNPRSGLGRGNAEFLRGLAFEALGRPEAAVPCLERALRASSGDGDVALALGRTLSMMDEHARARPFLEKAVAAAPDSAEAQNALGLALYRTGFRTKARAAFERAVKLSPEVSFLVNLGRTCAEEDLFQEAKGALDRALRLDPCSAEAHASMALLCHRLGDTQSAMRHAREALSEAPDDDTVQELLKMIGGDDEEDDLDDDTAEDDEP